MESQEVQFKLRLPVALKATLERLAEKSGRTITAEIVHRLQLSLQVPRDSKYELRGIVESLDRQRVQIEGMHLKLAQEREVTNLILGLLSRDKKTANRLAAELGFESAEQLANRLMAPKLPEE